MDTKKLEISYKTVENQTIDNLKIAIQNLPIQIYEDLNKNLVESFSAVEVLGSGYCDPILFKGDM